MVLRNPFPSELLKIQRNGWVMRGENQINCFLLRRRGDGGILCKYTWCRFISDFIMWIIDIVTCLLKSSPCSWSCCCCSRWNGNPVMATVASGCLLYPSSSAAWLSCDTAEKERRFTCLYLNDLSHAVDGVSSQIAMAGRKGNSHLYTCNYRIKWA
jgi:hypothetical protein